MTNVCAIKRYSIILGPVLGFGLSWWLHGTNAGLSSEACLAAGFTLWTVVWWVFEPIPIPVTSLLPLALFPLFGVIDKTEVAKAYGDWLIILLMGGFILSKSIEKSGVHRRIALMMVNAFGHKSDRMLVFSFMLVSALLSMWISNTATTLMLLPIVLAVVQHIKNKELSLALLLGIAYAANIGGVGTPIGTPPNLIFINQYKAFTGETIDFLQWMKWGVPLVIVFVPIMTIWLTRNLNGRSDTKIPEPGKWRQSEIRILIVFALTALAWVSRDMGGFGWKHQLGLEGANDASVALLAVILCFIIPDGEGQGERLLDWKHASQIPWGLLLLFAGGLAIGSAFKLTGLSSALGEQFGYLTRLPTFLLIICICLVVTFLTEVTSNTATTAILMPILGAIATSADMNHLHLMLPAVMSASCAFMLPVATAPNAVVYGSEQLNIDSMIRNGLVINLIGAVLISLLCYFMT